MEIDRALLKEKRRHPPGQLSNGIFILGQLRFGRPKKTWMSSVLKEVRGQNETLTYLLDMAPENDRLISPGGINRNQII